MEETDPTVEEQPKKKKFWLLQLLKNKYVLVVLIFLVWMLFFDRHNISYLLSLREQAAQSRQDLEYYKKEIRETRTKLEELTSDQQKLEKFGRETYFMKRADEDVFVFVPEKSP